MNKTYLTNSDIFSLCDKMYNEIRLFIQQVDKKNEPLIYKIYGIPRGGIPVAYVLQNFMECQIVNKPEIANIFVDDIIDSKATKARYVGAYSKPFFALITQPTSKSSENPWYIFPWEVNEKGEDESATDNITRLIQYIGEDSNREGLLETPERVIKAWDHWCGGYDTEPSDVLKVFEDGAKDYDEMVVVKNLPFYSHCEHHMAPFFGTITVGYIPNGKIVGLSKISRLIDIFARRLQVQERLTCQIADAIDMHLNPVGVGVLVTARHLCMESRGIQQQGHETITSAVRGVCRDLPEARNEFMSLALN